MAKADRRKRVEELADILQSTAERLPGICTEDLTERVLHALQTYPDEGAALQSLRASLANSAFKSSQEINTVWQAFKWGGRQFPLFPRFMYGDYDRWKAVAESHPYSQLHKALADADMAIMPEVANLIAQRRISVIYSMGPSPDVDKVLLEHVVRSGLNVTYCPVDVNAGAVKVTIDQITQHLTTSFGSDFWKAHVLFGERKATEFGEVKNGKSEPACVIYSGGTIMNDRKLWLQAARIAQKDGIIVASSAVTPEDSDYSDYWLSFYDTPEGKAIHEAALRKAFPDLFSEKNRGKWSVEFEYVTNPHRATAYWANYHTPRISVQLRVKEPTTLSVDGSPINLLPTRTWKQVEEWENWRSEFRRRFDGDEGIAAAIKEAYEHDDFSLLPQECKKGYPIELITSAKLLWPDFLMLVPSEFGLEHLSFVGKKIDYAKDGKQGLAMAAVFTVDSHPSFVPGLKEPSIPTWWPPQYAHDPAYLAWQGSLANTPQTSPQK